MTVLLSNGGSSLVGSLGGVEDGCYFELEDYVSSEEVAGYPLVLQWPRDDSPVPRNCKFLGHSLDWVFYKVQ